MAYNPQLAVYATYVLPSGGLYATYHLLREPETITEFLLSQLDMVLGPGHHVFCCCGGVVCAEPSVWVVRIHVIHPYKN